MSAARRAAAVTGGPGSPGARATARWRRRRAKNSFIVPVEVFGHEVETLVRLGFLAPGDAADRRRVGRAVADLVERVLGRAAYPGRPL